MRQSQPLSSAVARRESRRATSPRRGLLARSRPMKLILAKGQSNFDLTSNLSDDCNMTGTPEKSPPPPPVHRPAGTSASGHMTGAAPTDIPVRIASPKVSPKIMIFPDDAKMRLGSDIDKQEGTPRSRVLYMEPATPNCGRLAAISTIEDLMEGGLNRSYLSDECSGPSPQTQAAWEQCFMMVGSQKQKFRMFISAKSQRFLLSAWTDSKRECFYISQYKDFPDEAESSEQARDKHHCCSLRRVPKTKKYELWSRSCVYCDQVLGKYTCESIAATSCGDCRAKASSGTSSTVTKSREKEQRQMLAEIRHGSVKVRCGKRSSELVDSRSIDLRIPALTDPEEDKPLPSGWCTRQARSSVPSITIRNCQPKWNEALGSLSLRFANNRVRAASKKNFICFVKSMPTRGESVAAAAGKPPPAMAVKAVASNYSSSMAGRREQELKKKNIAGCLQVGKVRRGRFNIDFKFPISPVQAFAVALCTFNWLGQ